MSPEQLQNAEGTETPQTTKWDIFPFGVMMWEVATRKKPWVGVARPAITDKVLAGERLPTGKGWDWRFVDLLERCWHHDPKKRPEFRSLRKSIASSRFIVPMGEGGEEGG
jgi:hypothetical protein